MLGRLLAISTLAVAGMALAATVQGATPSLEFAFSELVTLGKEITPGATAYGKRNIVPITGGTFEGPNILGEVMPGGWDWQLQRADGCSDVKADYMIRTDDGAVINILNLGALCPSKPGASP